MTSGKVLRVIKMRMNEDFNLLTVVNEHSENTR